MRPPLACTVLALTLTACADPSERMGLARQEVDDPTAWKIVDVADFNGDGLADAMWSDQEGGHMAIWLIRAHSLLEAGPVIAGPGPGWVAVTGADFNGDGFADALWWNSEEQRFSVWLMAGSEVIERGPEIPAPAGARWQTTTAGDLNGDGFADIVFYGEKHSALSVYLMHGPCVIEAGPEVPGPPGHDWTAVLTGDTNLDHMQDVIWFNPSTTQMSVWLMAGDRVLEPGPLIPGPPGKGWAMSYDADFNFDGMFDVLWSDADRGSAEVWLVQATHVIEAGPEIPGPPGTGWTANAAADADGDGLGDIFWCKAGHHPSMSITTLTADGVAVTGAEIPGPQ